MKLIRFGAPGAEKPGLVLGNGARVDASSFGSDWDERFFGSDGLARLGAAASWVGFSALAAGSGAAGAGGAVAGGASAVASTASVRLTTAPGWSVRKVM